MFPVLRALGVPLHQAGAGQIGEECRGRLSVSHHGRHPGQPFDVDAAPSFVLSALVAAE